jgi:Hg(II)-responsive transcriptional regulator
MRTGQTANEAGVNVQTLRYYERRGILQPPPRRVSGYREYPSDAVRIVRFVKRAQELGFTLTEVESLLGLAAGGPKGCEAAQVLASEKITDLDSKIASLASMRNSLRKLLDTCSRPRRERECPLIQSIEADATDRRPELRSGSTPRSGN